MFQAAFFIVAIGSACSSNSSRNDLPDVQAVPHIDLERYAGRWYEIASRPNRFQAGCTGTTATYTLNSDGTITAHVVVKLEGVPRLYRRWWPAG